MKEYILLNMLLLAFSINATLDAVMLYIRNDSLYSLNVIVSSRDEQEATFVVWPADMSVSLIDRTQLRALFVQIGGIMQIFFLNQFDHYFFDFRQHGRDVDIFLNGLYYGIFEFNRLGAINSYENMRSINNFIFCDIYDVLCFGKTDWYTK